MHLLSPVYPRRVTVVSDYSTYWVAHTALLASAAPTSDTKLEL